MYCFLLSKGFENPKGCSDISKGFEYYNINEIISGAYKWGSFKAKIISLPNNISKGFLNIRV
jgi:hypothetical protein